MSDIKIYNGKLPKNLHSTNRDISLILADDNATLLTHTVGEPSGNQVVADDVVFLVALTPEKKESKCICIKIGDKIYLVDLSDPKKPKIREVEKVN